jgi:N-acetylmuramoyl-L-alanine amidase
VVAQQYYERYRRPLMHTETNHQDAREAPRWLWRQWHNVQLLRQAGVPIVGFTWYSLTDQIDWDAGLAVSRGNINPVGLFDLNRDPRLVGFPYREDPEQPAFGASAADLWRVLVAAEGTRELTAGAFDIAVGPLTSLWRQARRSGRLPTADKLAAAKAAVGAGTVELVPETQSVRLPKPGTRLDPRGLRLVGTSAERWQMVFGGNLGVLQPIGEGDLDAPSAPSWRARPPQESQLARGPMPSAEGLPEVPRGRYRVVIDPGHGGPDPGAVGIRGLRETDVVLDVSLQVAQLLQAKGVEVLLTRTSEVDVDLPPRVALANSSGADLFLSLHANALSMDRPDVNGIETFFFETSASRALAASVQQQVVAVSPGSPDRGVRQARFFVIRRTVLPSSLLEMGFVTGNLDAPRLADPAHRRRLALAVAAGILQALGQLAVMPGGATVSAGMAP